MFQSLLNMLFPLHCFLCRRALDSKEIPYLCSAHHSQLVPIKENYCPRCSLPKLSVRSENCPDCSNFVWAFESTRSLFLYKEPLSEIITAFKYHKKRFLFQTVQALLNPFIDSERCGTLGFQLVSAVPLHPEREKERGFNQSGLIAEYLSKKLNVPFEKKILKRVRHKSISSQVGLSRAERLSQIKGEIKPGSKAKLLQGKKVLLIDDVFTTGATVQECSRVLKSLGASKVMVLTLARTPFKTT